MASGEVRAGKAFVEVGLKDQYSAALAKLEGKLKSFGDATSAVGKQIATVGIGIGAALLAASATFAQVGDSIAKASTRTGVAAGTLSELSYAASQSGTDLETLEKSFNKMAKTVASAAGGNAQAIASLNALGLSAQQLINLSPDEQFKLIADSISKISNPTEKAAAALNIFGKSGTQLIPLMEGGAAGINELQQAARNLGVSFSTQDAKAAEEFGDRLDDLRKVVTAIVFQIGAAASPTIRKYTKDLTESGKSVVEYIKANRESIAVYATAAARLAGYAVAIGGAVYAFGSLISLAGAAVGTIASIGKAVSSVAALGKAASAAASLVAANPIVLAVVGAGAIIAAINGIEEYARVTEKVSGLKLDTHVAADIADQAKEARDKTLGLIQTLEKLNGKSLNPSDNASAQAAIAELNKRYGDVGASIDKNTGKLAGFAEAQKRVTEDETKAEIQRQLAIAKEANENAQRKQTRINDLANNNGSFLDRPANNARIDALTEQAGDQNDIAAAARAKAKALADQLRSTGTSDIFKDAKPKGSAVADDEDVEASKDHLKELADARKKLDELNNQQKLSGLDETAKKIEEVNTKYADQVELLKLLYAEAQRTGNAKDQGSLKSEFINADKERAAAVDKINKEQADKDKKTEEDKAAFTLKLQEDIAEKQGNKTQSEALKRQVAAVEFAKQLDAIFGTDGKDQQGRNRATELFKQSQVPELKGSSAGTFDLATSGQSLQSGGAMDVVAKNTTQANVFLKTIAKGNGTSLFR